MFFSLLYLINEQEGEAAIIMKEITDGLKMLLLDNHYTPVTIRFYECESKKIQAFLHAEYGDEGFDMKRGGLAYLEK